MANLAAFLKNPVFDQKWKEIRKICSKYRSKLYIYQVLFPSFIQLVKNRIFVKSGLIGQFLQNEVLKITNKKIFVHKIKNAPILGFQHKFSISAQKVIPRGLVEAPDPEEANLGPKQ